MEPIGLRWRWGCVVVSTRRIESGPAAPTPAVSQATVAAAPTPIAARDFDQFYRDHRDEIGRALVFTLGDASLGQEAVDEGMARAYQRWGQLAATSNPAGWVYVAGRRWGLSWRRGRTRERRRERFVADTQLTTDPALADYVDLMDALGELPVDRRTVVVCRFSLGYSVKETAAVLGISEGTVKSRLSRSMDQLRSLMEVDL